MSDAYPVWFTPRQLKILATLHTVRVDLEILTHADVSAVRALQKRGYVTDGGPLGLTDKGKHAAALAHAHGEEDNAEAVA